MRPHHYVLIAAALLALYLLWRHRERVMSAVRG